MSKLVYVVYALIITIGSTAINMQEDTSATGKSSRSWSGNNRGLSGGNWYSGGNHK